MSTPTIAVLGATGGCALAFLIRALQSGHKCIVLVRTPSKLQNLLETHSVSADVIATHLTIIEGNVKDSSCLSKVLFPSAPNTTSPGPTAVDHIVSGIGGTPVFMPNPLRPTLDDPTICQDAISSVLATLKSRSDIVQKPLMVVISTTGISDHGRDIPVAMIPLYHWMLPIPHKDKKEMERLLAREIAKGASSSLRGYVAVRASLLTDGPAKGVDKVRVGVEADGKAAQSAIGYTISRSDVGAWIFEELVEDKKGVKKSWTNKLVSITY